MLHKHLLYILLEWLTLAVSVYFSHRGLGEGCISITQTTLVYFVRMVDFGFSKAWQNLNVRLQVTNKMKYTFTAYNSLYCEQTPAVFGLEMMYFSEMFMT